MTNEELFFDALKAHRESNNIEISEICEFTKISPRYIGAIESGDFNVLPVVYMRLFLRAYANFIGADSIKALEDFELHTTGKIQKKVNIDPRFEIENLNTAATDGGLASIRQISPMKIATGAAVVIGVFLVLYWAGKITSEQKSMVENKPNLIDSAPQKPEIIPVEGLKGAPEEKKNLLIDKIEESAPETPINTPKISSVEVSSISNNLSNQLPLNTNDFRLENRTRESTKLVKLFKPYSINIVTLSETKLNITKSDNSLLTVLINSAVPAGREYEFNFKSTINFEFLNNAHIKVKLNEIPLDNFLSDDGLSIRGSYEVDKSQLYLGFYQN